MKARALLLTMALCSTAAAVDDERTAEEFFTAAATAYHRGEFRAAAEAFESAHAHAPRAATILNAGRAWDEAREPARAATAYRSALQLGGLGPDDATHAKSRLDALEPQLARLRLSGPAGSMVSADAFGKIALPATVYVLPGEHELRVLLADGTTHSRRVGVKTGEHAFSLAPPPATPPPKPPKATPPPPRDTGTSAQVVWGWIGIGAGTAAAGAAILLGVEALDARDRYDASDHRDAQARDDAESLRLWTNVAWAGAAVLAGTGVTLVLTSSPTAATSSGQALRVGPGAVSWSGRF